MIRYDFQKWTILTLGLVTISLSVGLVLQYAHGFVDGNNNGKDDVQEFFKSCKEGKIYFPFPEDCYDTHPKDYSLSQNRQNLSETSCYSNTIVYWHNGKCYAEDPEGILK
jgi:hypothetical protein